MYHDFTRFLFALHLCFLCLLHAMRMYPLYTNFTVVAASVLAFANFA